MVPQGLQSSEPARTMQDTVTAPDSIPGHSNSAGVDVRSVPFIGDHAPSYSTTS
jgi:hypothetical protein